MTQIDTTIICLHTILLDIFAVNNFQSLLTKCNFQSLLTKFHKPLLHNSELNHKAMNGLALA